MVTTGPMAQVGWASACSTVTSASASAGRPRNGPPLAVSTSRATSPRVPPRRHWTGAERGQRRAQPDRAGDRVQDDVGEAGGELLGGARPGEDLRERVLALGPAALRGGRVEGQLEVLRGGGAGHGDGADAEAQRLL